MARPVLKSLMDVLAPLPLRQRRNWFPQFATWCKQRIYQMFLSGQTLACNMYYTCWNVYLNEAAAKYSSDPT
jgi:hypothetical protein